MMFGKVAVVFEIKMERVCNSEFSRCPIFTNGDSVQSDIFIGKLHL